MQPIQTTVLEKRITPGDVPVFIVGPEPESGMKLSLLLSVNATAPKAFSRIYDDITPRNNYFFNTASRRILKSAAGSGFARPAEEREKIKLLLEESFDNGKLWGLQCDMEQFFRLELHTIYKAAFYCFIYNEADTVTAHDLPFLKQMRDFSRDHPDECVVLHYKSVQHHPELVLSRLPFIYHNGPLTFDFSGIDEEDEADVEQNLMEDGRQLKKANTSAGIMPASGAGDVISALNELHVFSRHRSLLTGDDVTIILSYENHSFKGVLADKLADISQTFIQFPAVHIIVNTKEEGQEVTQLLTAAGSGPCRIEVAADRSVAAVINSIAGHSNNQMILIDGLHFGTSFAAMLVAFDADDTLPVLTFGKPSKAGAVSETAIGQADVLTTHIIQNTLAFPRLLWQQINMFDESLDTSVFLWDFMIRAINMVAGPVLAIAAPASEKPEDIEYSEVSRGLMQSRAYQDVITKHRQVFEENFLQLLELLSDQQHLPQHEIKDLHHKISNLQALLRHSKNELKAITDLSRALQRRINVLENRWHYKLAAKVKRIKKIFFKKNTEGTGRLKKFLRFMAFTVSRPGIKIVRKVSKNGLKKMYMLAEDRPVKISYLDETDENDIRTYHDWIRVRQDIAQISKTYENEIRSLTIQPKISIVMPVYNPPLKYLKQAIESVLRQDYQNWEFCIADDCSPGDKVRKLLNAYTLKDSRIKIHYRTENGHISASSNSALELATGDFVLLMDHDDLLSADCLFEVVKHINEHPEDDIIYSDEDKIDEAGRHTSPHFKPDWAPHSLLSRNYFGHVVVMRKRIIDQIGGFRLGFEGSQDYDLILRATEATTHIGHIPKVLYHWRIHGKSAAHSEEVKPYAYIAAKKALEEALERRGTPGTVSYLSGLRGYRIHYDIGTPGKVSIIIPTKDHVKLLKNTVDSILHHTDYSNHEIIVLNNNSTSKEFFTLVADYAAAYPDKFRCIDCNFPFNFSKLMNIGAAAATGEYLLLLNNDVEVIHEDWLQRMVAQAQHKNTGAVGVKLLYPDDHIQHAGVIVGLGGVAGHVFVNAFKDDAGYFNYIQSVNNFSAVTAACLICRKSVYEEVGGMNEAFEVEYNDVDLCLRFVEAGYYNVYLPDVELYHYESATRGHPHQSRESWDRHVREIKLFKAEWQKYIDHDPYYNPNLNIGAHDFSMNFSANTKKVEHADA